MVGVDVGTGVAVAGGIRVAVTVGMGVAVAAGKGVGLGSRVVAAACNESTVGVKVGSRVLVGDTGETAAPCPPHDRVIKARADKNIRIFRDWPKALFCA